MYDVGAFEGCIGHVRCVFEVGFGVAQHSSEALL